MKSNKLLVILFFAAALLLNTSCYTGHSDHVVDSVKNNYNAPSNIDTGKVTTTTGDASVIDNGGSGGTGIAKPQSTDTSNTANRAKNDSAK